MYLPFPSCVYFSRHEESVLTMLPLLVITVSKCLAWFSDYLGLNPTQLLLGCDWGQSKSAVAFFYYKMKNIVVTLL